MRSLIFKFTPLLVLISACVAPDERPQELLIEKVTIVSAHLPKPRSNQHVLIRDGRIGAISSNPFDVDRSVQRLDGRGLFLTPGLMDSHHHVSFVPGLGARGQSNLPGSRDLERIYMQQQPRSLLYHGVTQIVDPAPLPGFESFNESPLHPDLFNCGQIPNPNGYPGNQIANLESDDLFEYEITEATGDTPASVVDRIAKDGAVCVKIFFEDGFGESTAWPLLIDRTVKRIRAAAHRNGLLVVAHANAIDMYQLALDANVDIIAHGLWNWQWPSDPEAPPVTDTLDRVFKNGIGYMPTHSVMSGLAGMMSEETPDDPEFPAVVPPQLLDWYKTNDGMWFARELATDFSPGMTNSEISEVLMYGYERAKRATAYLYEKGLPLLLASDCPGSATYANQPGLCTIREMRSWAESGIPPHAIFEAATINNATRFGLSEQFGTVEEGKIANLLLLSANPLEDVRSWDQIEYVILHGQLVLRKSLTAISR